MTVHKLKCWPPFFEEVLADRKRHELRRNDRDFKVGDILLLEEWIPETKDYTGRAAAAQITYITSQEHVCALFEGAMNKDFCILSISLVLPAPALPVKPCSGGVL